MFVSRARCLLKKIIAVLKFFIGSKFLHSVPGVQFWCFWFYLAIDQISAHEWFAKTNKILLFDSGDKKMKKSLIS